MTFYETRFPPAIGAGATGGPTRLTDVVTLRSGYEEVNSIWQNSRRRWNASYGVKDVNDLHQVVEFWEAMGGRRHSFRWKDWADFKSVAPKNATSSADQTIGIGDGATVGFQLVKVYAAGAASYTRPIKKPVAGTVKVSVNGINLVQGVGFAVDTTTGIVALTIAPSVGQLVKAGFEFDVPARFDTDTLSTQIELYQAGVATIDIMEVRI